MTDTNIEFPEKGLIDRDDYDLYSTRRPTVVLAVEREVVNHIIIRNNDTEQAETQVINDKTRAQSNPEKFTTPERLTGLDLLRQLDEDDDLISEEYRHNEIPGLEETVNMDAITYGVAGTGDQNFGMKSRLMTGYTYTVGEYDIIASETRNAAYETGSMTDGDGEHSQSLYEVTPVQPGNAFVQFLSLEAATPGMLAYVLHNIQNTHGYGARDSRTGKTIENHIRAIVFSDQPTLLSAGEFLQEEDPTTDEISEAIGSYLQSVERSNWEAYGDETVDAYPDFPEWLENLLDVTARKAENAEDELRGELVEDTETARDAIIGD